MKPALPNRGSTRSTAINVHASPATIVRCPTFRCPRMKISSPRPATTKPSSAFQMMAANDTSPNGRQRSQRAKYVAPSSGATATAAGWKSARLRLFNVGEQA
jgi:hypothetical protein